MWVLMFASLSDNMNISVSPLQPLCSLIMLTFCILLDFFLFWLSSPFITWHPSEPLTLWLLLPTDNFVSYILCCLFFCFGHFSHSFFQRSGLPHFWSSSSNPLVHLMVPCHLFEMSHPPFCSVPSPFSFPSFLPPNRPSTHHHIDGERHVPEQNKGAAWSREGQCTLLPPLLCIIHLLTPLPHGCARHSWISGGRGRGARGPKTRRKWGFCRRRWWEQQWQCIIECGWRTPAPVTHLPEHHRCACALYGYHDCGWVASYALYPSGIISCLAPFPYRSHIMCAPFNYKCLNSGTQD